MKRLLFFFPLLLLACSLSATDAALLPTQPAPQIAATATSHPVQADPTLAILHVTTIGQTWLHSQPDTDRSTRTVSVPDGTALDVIQTDQFGIYAVSTEPWRGMFIWSGCVNDNPLGLGCEAR